VIFGYLLRRLAGAVLVLTAVTLLTFLLLDQAPGDAATALVGESASAEGLAQVRHSMGLDLPVIARYGSFLSSAVFHGDLGKSLVSNRPVVALLRERFGYTLQLALMAMLAATLLGSLAGALAARSPGSPLDLAMMAVSTLGLSLPTFWVAMLLIMVLSLRWGWLPVVGAGSPAHLVLPTITLALPTTALVARLVRSNLLDVQGADYVRTAHAKGLLPSAVWRHHILRNCLIPIVTLLSLQLGHLLGGTFLVETIFAWPGLGRLVVQAVFERDYPVLVGAVLLIALIFQVLNLLADLLHAWLDPRVGRGAL
jgi:ABC-type dipeptide/oligopeptide/nickel transport system permease component